MGSTFSTSSTCIGDSVLFLVDHDCHSRDLTKSLGQIIESHAPYNLISVLFLMHLCYSSAKLLCYVLLIFVLVRIWALYPSKYKILDYCLGDLVDLFEGLSRL